MHRIGNVLRRYVTSLATVLLFALLLASCAGNRGAELKVVSAVATSKTSLVVTFSDAVGEGAGNPSNYNISGPDGSRLQVVAAYPDDGGTTVTLATDPQEQVTYVLTVSNVKAANGGQMVSQIQTTGAFGGSGESAPIVASAVALSNTTVLITFADPVNGQPAAMSDSALNIRYYTVDDRDLTILSAALTAGGSGVILTTVPQADKQYTIKVTNVTSRTGGGRLVDPFNSTATFAGIPVNDTVPPRVLRATAISNSMLLITFSEPVREDAADVGNYHIVDADNNVLVVTEAVLNEFGTQVTLTTLPQTENVDYTLTVTGVRDKAGNLIAPDPGGVAFTGVSNRVPPGADVTPPRVTNAGSITNTTVLVTFSEPVLGGPESAENPAQYRITANLLSNELATQATLLITEAVLSADKTTVTLRTGSQSDIRYTLEVTNVKDLAGNQIAPPQLGVSNPNAVTFVGTPPGPGELIDSDGDGLTDDEEMRGWVVTIKLLDGSTVRREVTSDPYNEDTDGDGIGDFDEKHYGTDPRNPDTDTDGLTDYEELNYYYSDPAHQDSDGDGLTDGLEVTFFGTSPLLADTDGDQFTDDYEVITDNRNPRIADLPRPSITVGEVDLRLDVRFSATSSTGRRELETRAVQTTFTQTESQSFSRSDAQTTEWFLNAGAEVCIKGGCEEAAVAGAKFSVEGGYSDSHTAGWTSESSRAAQEEYIKSLTTDREVTTDETITREVVGATMAISVNVSNAGNIAFTISNIEITALIQDPRDSTRLIPVATLTGNAESINLGPINPNRGPFRFATSDAFPSLVEDLLADPRGLIFKIANYDIIDEFGRNFAFTEQDVNDRTASLVIDYVGNLPLERLQVATNSRFDESGRATGITMQQALEDVLGLEFVAEAQDKLLNPFNRDDANLIDRSYSTRMINGVESLYRVRGVSEELLNLNRKWFVITPLGHDPGLDFKSIVLKSDQSFKLTFEQDLDEDFLPARVEFLYGSADSDRPHPTIPGRFATADFDEDGIDDGDEVYGLFVGNKRRPWLVQPVGQEAYKTFSSPGRADTDLDGLTDCQELVPRTPSGTPFPCAEIKVYLDAGGLPTIRPASVGGTAHTLLRTMVLSHPTDPRKADTDGDGLTDLEEIIGFSYTDVDSDALIILTANTDASTTYATNPLDRDTDGDGLADGREKRIGTNPIVADGNRVQDADGDGLVNIEETQGWTVSYVNSSGQTISYAVTSDPGKFDTDGDGLNDFEERELGTDPRKADTDGDGLSDFEEARGVNFPFDSSTPYRFTDPLKYDTDGDGRSDGAEVKTPWTVRVVGQAPYQVFSDPLIADADLDGLPDGEEFTQGSDPYKHDTDGDGRDDRTERTFNLNPLEKDFRVTVVFTELYIHDDGDSGGAGAGDFSFRFQVRKPNSATPTGLASVTDVIVSWIHVVDKLRNCTGGDDNLCRGANNPASPSLIQMTNESRLRFDDMSELSSVVRSTTFTVTASQRFTIEGFVCELDSAFLDCNSVDPSHSYIKALFGGLEGIGYASGGGSGGDFPAVFEGNMLQVGTTQNITFTFDNTNTFKWGANPGALSGVVKALYIVD